MPRIRTIKPEFATDEKLAKVSREARLTFVLLVTQADDDGLLNGRMRQLLGALYPHDEDVGAAQLDHWLKELEHIGAVRWRETVDAAPVIELVNWSKHQRIDHKGRSMLLPELRPLHSDSREFREILASDSRESRAPTLDLGPRTENQGPAAAARARGEIRVELARTANDALDAAFGTADPRRRPLLPASAAAVLEVLDADAIPLEFACTAIRDAVPALKEPPRSLAYFAPIIRERWGHQNARGPTSVPSDSDAAIERLNAEREARRKRNLASGVTAHAS